MTKIYAALSLTLTLPCTAQSLLKKSGWEMKINKKGTLEQIIFNNGATSDTIPFFKGQKNDGPSFYMKDEKGEQIAEWIPNGKLSYRASLNGVECRLTYKEHNSNPAMEVTMINHAPVPFQPHKAGLKLGIDTYMERYPEWFGKYFPTLLRNEKSHFYGYLQSPAQHTVALVSEQPVASWSIDYNLGYMDPAPHWFMGHRIESLNLDLLNRLPLPSHYPQDLFSLEQGEEKKWTFTFVNVGSLSRLEERLATVADIPLINMEKTSFVPGEEAVFEVTGKNPIVRVTDDHGKSFPVSLTSIRKNCFRAVTKLDKEGFYHVEVIAADKSAQGILTVHRPWAWTLNKARENVITYHQKPTTHAESWYGYYSAFIAAKNFPDKKTDNQLSDRFEKLFALLHDSEKMEPVVLPNRIQNTSTTIGLLVDKFEAYGDIRDLERAAALADWMISFSQREDGAYYNHGTIYTSVIYVAKSVLELAQVEKRLADKNPKWKDAYLRHYASAKAAIDQLVSSRGDFQTEGELTFEDGMISCSALQIGMLALMEESPESRKQYTEALLPILESHSCLTQLKVPDARRRQGTLRYWEAQYDVQMLPNMFNSPHGWSGWRAYATYYAYLLTGEEKWLLQTFNAMGAFANLIDYKSGDLRWAFVVDPHLEVEQACSADTRYTFDDVTYGNPHPKLYDTRKFIIGEQYVRMVSDWQTVNTQDNDVHELFKCMGEAVLNNAFIIERENGEIVGYNCAVQRNGKKLKVTPHEKQIVNLHCNLKNNYLITFEGKNCEWPGGKCDWMTGGPF